MDREVGTLGEEGGSAGSAEAGLGWKSFPPRARGLGLDPELAGPQAAWPLTSRRGICAQCLGADGRGRKDGRGANP